jgi:hypothetical protein
MIERTAAGASLNPKEVAMSASIGRAHLASAFGAIYLLWGGTYLAIALARIMHHAERFWRSGGRSRAGDPSVWIGVRPLAVQHVWD